MLQPNALCTVEDIENELEGTDLPDEAVIERHINAVSDWIELHCRRIFRAQDNIEEMHGSGSRITLKRPPIRALVSAPEFTVGSPEGGVLVKHCCPTPGRKIMVVYDGGFDPLPAAVVDACIRLVSHRITDSALDDSGVTSVREGGVSVTRTAGNGVPSGILESLAPYRLART